MKKFLLFLLSLFVGVALFFWVVQSIGWQEIKITFSLFTGWEGIFIIFLTFLGLIIGTWKWKEILKGMGESVSLKNLFGAYLAGFAIMYLFPALILGSEAFKGYALKQKKQIHLSKGAASVIIDRILEITASLIVIFSGALFFIVKIGPPEGRAGLILGLAFFIFLLAAAFFYLKIFRKESLVKFFIKEDQNQLLQIEREMFDFFRIKRAALWKSLGLSFLKAGIVIARSAALISFLGKNIGAGVALSVSGFYYLAIMIPIPADLGTQEIFQAFAFNSLGLTAGVGTAFAIIIRGAELFAALIGVLILFKLGTELVTSNIIKKITILTKSSK